MRLLVHMSLGVMQSWTGMALSEQLEKWGIVWGQNKRREATTSTATFTFVHLCHHHHHHNVTEWKKSHVGLIALWWTWVSACWRQYSHSSMYSLLQLWRVVTNPLGVKSHESPHVDVCCLLCQELIRQLEQFPTPLQLNVLFTHLQCAHLYLYTAANSFEFHALVY